MKQFGPQRLQDPDYGIYHGDDDRRRYRRRQKGERRELIRFDRNHVKRRSGDERRIMPAGQLSGRAKH